MRRCRRVGKEQLGNVSSGIKSLSRIVLECFRFHHTPLGMTALPPAAWPGFLGALLVGQADTQVLYSRVLVSSLKDES